MRFRWVFRPRWGYEGGGSAAMRGLRCQIGPLASNTPAGPNAEVPDPTAEYLGIWSEFENRCSAALASQGQSKEEGRKLLKRSSCDPHKPP